MSSTFDDPECSFRRGYVHGSLMMLNAVATVLPAAEYERLRRWIDGDLTKWRRAVRPKVRARTPTIKCARRSL